MKKILTILLLAAASVPVAMGQGALILPTVAPAVDSVPAPHFAAIPPRGYCGSAMIDMQAPGPYGPAAFGITTTHGAMITDRHFIGVGAGVLEDFSNKLTIVPVYAEGRLYFKSSTGRIYPNIGIRLGGMFVAEGSAGLYGALAMGVRIPLSRRVGLLAEIGPQIASKYERPQKDAALGSKFERAGSQFGVALRIGITF